MTELTDSQLRSVMTAAVEEAYRAGHDDGVKVGREQFAAEMQRYERGQMHGRIAVEKVLGRAPDA